MMHNSNFSMPFNVNITNPMEYIHGHSNQPFPSLPHPIRSMSNVNNISCRPEPNLVRPIPQKVDLSGMLYQQMMDPYTRSVAGAREMKNVGSENYYNSIQKIYHESFTNGTMPHNNAAKGINELTHQMRNSNTPYNDPRILLNHYLSSHSASRSGLLSNQFYNNGGANFKSPDMPMMSATDSYLFNNINQQILLRKNQVDRSQYAPMNGSEEPPILKHAIRDDINGNNTVQYYPKPSLSDKFVDNRLSMPVNTHMMFNYKDRDCQIISSKLDRINKKSPKQPVKTLPTKTNKLLKRNRKVKAQDSCEDLLSQNNLHENHLTTCATPSDSSISPVSMVSCRSTTTPQTLYPSLSNLASNHSDKSVSISSDKSRTDSVESTNHYHDVCKKHSADMKSIQGLPIKKRIKWQVEIDEYNDLDQLSTDNLRTKTIEAELEMGRDTEPVIEVDDKKPLTDSNESSTTFYSEDPLKTFQKTFLPMEQRSYSSDTESDNDLVIADYENI